MTSLIEAIILLFFFGIFSFLSYSRHWLDNDAILIASIVGLFTYLLGGTTALITLFAFFVIGEAATYFVKGKKFVHHQRRTANILGNASASMAALLMGSPLGFFGAISAALADTLSSEIGILSKKKPFMITTLKTVEPGIDGGVSALGLTASLAGSLLIGLIAFLFGFSLLQSILIVIAGVFGGIMDSLFGATIQRKGWVDNNEVNFLGSSAGAIFAAGIALVVGLV
jgi:uncharacterized protein (TIGR00297 family)